jgi:serine/threonine protein kinase
MAELATTGELSVEALVGQVADEFVQRLNRGEQPDIDDYARRHPEIDSVLRQVLAALQLVRLPGDDAGGCEGGIAGATVRGCLGDFRILREVGRGGMGVVYEAEQISLGRKVALKVLPFAAAMDPKQLQRFKNEAQAAAQLHHQNIVPVYGIGCERGVHYYAMQYIEGQTLAAIIGEMRREKEDISQEATKLAPLPTQLTVASAQEPTSPVAVLSTERSTRQPGYFRTVAKLGVQAAEALEHAHSLGIIHRDIKPANLIIQGEAGVSGPGVRLWVTDFGLARFHNEAGLTMSGDLLGTLRYMSPEQALAKHGLVDHRSDIYSLGATLYELLTLQPACPGQDRQEVLRRIEREDSPLPRSLNPAIPADLETIIVKALAKESDGRYTTAQELADDLRRFLDDQPIQARRPTVWQRTRKWARRHQGMVVTSVVASLIVLLTVVAALIVGIIHVKAEQRRTKDEHDAAVAARKLAEENQRLTMETYRLARSRLEKIVATVTEDPRLNGGELETVVRAVRTDAADFYQQFVALQRDDPDFQAERATTLAKLAGVTAALESLDKAIGFYAQARDLVTALTREHADVPRYQALLAKIEQDLGIVCRQTTQWEKAEEALQHAVALDRALVQNHSSVPEYQASLAFGLLNLASLYEQTNRSLQAEEPYQEALTLRQGLVERHPRVPRYQYDLACSYIELGTWHIKTRRFSAAELLLWKSLPLLETLVGVSPNPPYRWALAGAHHNLSLLYQETERLSEAEESLRAALAQQQVLARQSPLVTQYKVDLGGTLGNLAALAELNGDLDACLDWAAQSITALEAVRAKERRHSVALQFLGNAYQGRFKVLNRLQRYAESLHDLDKLLELQNRSSERNELRLDRALILARLHRHAEATAEAEDLLEFSQSHGARLYKSAAVYALAAAAQDADRPQAEQYAARAVQLLQQTVTKGFKKVAALTNDADFDALRQRPDFQKLLTDLEEGHETLNHNLDD